MTPLRIHSIESSLTPTLSEILTHSKSFTASTGRRGSRRAKHAMRSMKRSAPRALISERGSIVIAAALIIAATIVRIGHG